MPSKTLQGPCAHCGCPIVYQAELVGTTTACPYCGKTTELSLETPPSEPTVPKRVIIWTSLAVLILVIGLVASGIAFRRAKHMVASKSRKGAVPSTAMGVVADTVYVYATNGFQVSRITVGRRLGEALPKALGNVSNALAQSRSGVTLQLELLDRSGRVIGTTMDSVASIGPNQVWTFRAPVLNTNAEVARVVTVTSRD